MNDFSGLVVWGADATEFVCINSDFVQYSVSAFVLETEIVLAKKRKDSNIYILIIKDLMKMVYFPRLECYKTVNCMRHKRFDHIMCFENMYN